MVYDPALVTRDGSTACELSHPPPRPPADTDGPDGPDMAFGLRDVVLNQVRGAWRDYGYDLDDQCTTAPEFLSDCRPPAGSNAPLDGPGGLDNSFGESLYPLVASAVGDLEATARAAQHAGRGLPVLIIRGWNGQRTDPRIDISITQAVFGTPGGPDDTAPPEVVIESPTSRHFPGGAEVPPPAWDGNDWFWVRSDSFVGGDLDRPLIRDDNAYVVDGTFVITLPSRIDIVFPADEVGVLVRLTGARATGQLTEDGLTMERSTVAGRWAIADLLYTAENVGVCEGTAEYRVLDDALERIADVRSDPSTGGMGLECDAISIGVGFTARRIRVAALTEGPPLGNVCASRTDGGMMSSDAGVPADAGGGMDSGR